MRPVFALFSGHERGFKQCFELNEPYIHVKNDFFVPAYAENGEVYGIPSFFEIGPTEQLRLRPREVPDVYFGAATDLSVFSLWLQRAEGGICPDAPESAYCFFRHQAFVSFDANFFCASAAVLRQRCLLEITDIVVGELAETATAIMTVSGPLKVHTLLEFQEEFSPSGRICFLGAEDAVRDAAFQFWLRRRDFHIIRHREAEPMRQAMQHYERVDKRAQRFLSKNPSFLL